MARPIIIHTFCEDVEKFLKVKKPHTRRPYVSALVKFRRFYQEKYGEDKTISDFLDRVSEDRQKPRGKRTRLAEQVITDFVSYMQKGNLTPNGINLYVAVVQNLLKYYDMTISTSFLALPKPIGLKENRKHEWSLEDVKEFFNACDNFRDKAIVLTLFQSGLGINELIELNYSDIRRELEKDILPLCLFVIRRKIELEYKTFIGRDAVHYLKLYLQTKQNLKDDSPVFTKLGSDERITRGSIEARFRVIAEKCSFILKSQMNNGHFNPARPHSLRSAFRSRLTGKMDGYIIRKLSITLLCPVFGYYGSLF
jgi:integrase